MLKPLPVGIQTFKDIIEGEFLYVDKTKWIYELIRYPKGVYFLARPRRFGKSLLISTLKEIFEGNRSLFKGLWLYEQTSYQWEAHPIIRIDFSLNKVKNGDDVKQEIKRYLERIAQQYQITLNEGEYHHQFADLISQLAAQNKVVILIDEYDKPIIDNIEDVEKARQIREVLKGFYAVIKGMDEHIRFVLLTGISKFSKVGVFSGLNNLEDISMAPQFSALLGITKEETDLYFQDYLTEFAAQEAETPPTISEKMKAWYDGFCFAGACQNVYNPFSLLLLFKQRRFANFWFESGTPTFLIKLIRENHYAIDKFDELELDELAFSNYEIETLQIIPLLFQTGYLTIKGYHKESRLYRLYYPNYEVEHAFLQHLLGSFSHIEAGLGGGYLWRLVQALKNSDLDRFFEVLAVFFADIPYDIQIKQEKYYQTIFYLIFKLIGLEVEAETKTSRGRIDAVIELQETLFLFEFKLDGDEQEALEQIKTMEYFQKYRLSEKQIYLVGVAFDTQQRKVIRWQAELEQ